MARMRVSAKADYAVRAAVELATQPAEVPVKADQVAVSQDIPLRFLENILYELRRNDIVELSRGADGGYYLSRPAAMITLAEVIRAVEGPVGSVHGDEPAGLTYLGSAKPLQDVWLALRANVRDRARVRHSGRRRRRRSSRACARAFRTSRGDRRESHRALNRRERRCRGRTTPARSASPSIWRHVAPRTMPSQTKMSANTTMAMSSAVSIGSPMRRR